jgi:hypothetical protein
MIEKKEHREKVALLKVQLEQQIKKKILSKIKEKEERLVR